MTHNRTDITDVHIGQAGRIPLHVQRPDGTDVSMVGGEARFAVVAIRDQDRDLANADIKIDKTLSGGGIQTVDAGAGELRVLLEPADTEDLAERDYWFRVNVEDSAGDPVPGAAAGVFELVRD
jgi:hypothetical protein